MCSGARSLYNVNVGKCNFPIYFIINLLFSYSARYQEGPKTLNFVQFAELPIWFRNQCCLGDLSDSGESQPRGTASSACRMQCGEWFPPGSWKPRRRSLDSWRVARVLAALHCHGLNCLLPERVVTAVGWPRLALHCAVPGPRTTWSRCQACPCHSACSLRTCSDALLGSPPYYFLPRPHATVWLLLHDCGLPPPAWIRAQLAQTLAISLYFSGCFKTPDMPGCALTRGWGRQKRWQ